MKIRSIYIKAMFLYTAYFVLTKYVLIASSLNKDSQYFFQISINIFFALIFLYLFENDNFFKFIKVIEKKEIKKEKKLEKQYLHFGKTLAAIIIALLTGPLVGALTFRFLVVKSFMRYVILVLSIIISSSGILFFAKGVINL